MSIGRLIDPNFQQSKNANDWRCDFTYRGEVKGCWVASSAVRDVVLASAMRHFNIFDRAEVSRVMIRRRKDIAQWKLDPKKLRSQSW